ncbi:MAG: hypothetical protein E7484_00590 [Ruminococcaceae bacterium]|nr:hypothetical protein [Oscillospiraceae bacterium]
MDNKRRVKTIVLIILVAVAVTAAFMAGSFIGKKNSTDTNIPADRPRPEIDSNSSENSEQNRMSDDIFNLITAFDEYMKASVQQAEVEIGFRFGAIETDEEFKMRSGTVDEVPVTHIQRGRLDIYICDGQVFVEDDNAHFSINKTEDYNSLNMKKLFAVVYEITQKGDFSVATVENETVYTLTLTQRQIDDIINSLQGTMEESNVVIEKGVLKITLENGTLESFDITCNGYMKILSSQVEGGISVETDLSVSEYAISVPASVMEQLK